MGAPPGTPPHERKLQVGGFWLGTVLMAVAFRVMWAEWHRPGEEGAPVAALVMVAVGLATALAMTIHRTSRPFGQGMLLGLLFIFAAGFFLFAAYG